MMTRNYEDNLVSYEENLPTNENQYDESESTSTSNRYTRNIQNIFTIRRWRLWIRPLVILIYCIIFLVGVPLFAWYLDTKATPLEQAWLIALVFMVFTIPISLWTILQHLIYYTQPDLQKHIIRILWMVPVYSIDSWVAIFQPSLAIYFDTFRECYEAYVIYNFLVYLLNFLSSEYELAGWVPVYLFSFVYCLGTLGTKDPQKHVFPFCCFKPWPMGGIFIERCKQGVLQYTIIRPLTTVIAFICQLANVYGEGHFKVNAAWLWIVIINNISQTWAVYCLILFYQATKEELQPLKPIGKFVCVKLVVFASFWQALAIAIIFEFVSFQPKWGWHNKDQMANGMQDFLICIEMLLAAIAHHFTFSHKPYIESDHNVPWYRSFRSMLDVSDVRRDVSDQMRGIGRTVVNTSQKLHPRRLIKNKEKAVNKNENSSLLSPSSSEAEMTNVVDYGGASMSCASISNSHVKTNEASLLDTDNSSDETISNYTEIK